jgi:hypothetical protein
MQYLLVHLPYEAKIGDPQQYRWMYHIERALKKLRTMVHNKSKVEGCITEEFKLKEIMYFSSMYFAEHHNGREYHTRTSFLFIFLLFFN